MIRPRDTCSQSHSRSVSVLSLSLSLCVCLSVCLSVSHIPYFISYYHFPTQLANRVQRRELKHLLLRCQHGPLLLINLRLFMYVKQAARLIEINV